MKELLLCTKSILTNAMQPFLVLNLKLSSMGGGVEVQRFGGSGV